MTILHNPPLFVNQYLQYKLATKYADLGLGSLPLFPTMPTDIASYVTDYKQFFEVFNTPGVPTTVNTTNAGLAGIYDRMFRMRKSPFPHIRCEQLLYYFYATTENAAVKMIELQQVVSDLFDGGDESAEDINAWIKAQPRGAIANIDGKDVETTRLYNPTRTSYQDFPMPYFHNFKIYQLQETRDIVDFGTARTYAGNKIIIEYDWHKSQ